MDKDRAVGIRKQFVGSVKKVAGELVGDAKLKADGEAERIAGKIQNAAGGLKDSLKGK